jgi:hypothetical protein
MYEEEDIHINFGTNHRDDIYISIKNPADTGVYISWDNANKIIPIIFNNNKITQISISHDPKKFGFCGNNFIIELNWSQNSVHLAYTTKSKNMMTMCIEDKKTIRIYKYKNILQFVTFLSHLRIEKEIIYNVSLYDNKNCAVYLHFY